MTSAAIILLSGGLDSATTLAIAKNQGYDCHAISFSYGQRHDAELTAAKNVALSLGAKSHRMINIDTGLFQSSALTDSSIAVPDYTGKTDIPITYVPARNILFLSYALALAEGIGAEAIFIGVSAIDFSHYPDCRAEFIDAFYQMAAIGTKAGVEGHPIKIMTPLQHLSKKDTVLLGTKLGVDYSLTISCYQADAEGRACGSCDSCTFRKKGFREALLADPTRYVYS